MSTNKDCGKVPCGCEDEPLQTPPPCESGTPECPDPDNCPETFAQECVVWTGDDLVCDTTVLATEGDRMDVVLGRIVQLFCQNASAGTQGIAVIVPAAEETLIGLTDRIVAVDRNNCHDTITFAPTGGPAGLLIDYTDENGALQSGQANLVMAASQSSIRFDFDVSGVSAGDYNFTLEATVCGVTLSIPVFITV